MKICINYPAQSYQTPEIELVEMMAEGVLCASATSPWEEDDSLNF